jgi:hypothetical protein
MPYWQTGELIMDHVILATQSYDSWRYGVIEFNTENGNWSWGWITDDFGNLTMPYAQVSGYGLWEAANIIH